MFIRPNWRDPESYTQFLKPNLNNWIAWEFLRRNPEYQEDFDQYRREVIEWCEIHSNDYQATLSELDLPDCFVAMRACHEDSGQFDHWNELFERRWKLCTPVLTTDNCAPELFVINVYDRPDLFQDLHGGFCIDGPNVLIPVDLSEPLEVLEKRLMWQVRRLRDDGIKRGSVIPRTARILSPRIYIEQLRILDAYAVGATVQEIGAVLSPGASNDPDSRQRDKRIKAAYKAALSMQDSGHKALLSNS